MLLKKGSRGEDVRLLQKGLAAFGYGTHPGSADGVFGRRTKEALEDWQTKVGTYPDGIFGRGSLKAWNAECAKKGLDDFKFNTTPSAPDPVDNGDKLTWVRCKSDKVGKGYSSCTLRSDTATAYNALAQEVRALGGVVTSAGGKRGLSSKASPSRSKKSFHYTGRAFDLALPTGMQNPSKDPYIVVRDESGNGRKWTVWCKVLDENAPGADSVETVTLDACYVVGKRSSSGKRYTQLQYKEWTGKAFNFTELAEKNGFERISGRRSFFKGGSYGGAEWWHFQWEEGMVKGQTTFGEELLKVYTLDQCKAFVYWDVAKDCKFGINWF